MTNIEFKKIKEIVSGKIIGNDEHPLDFEEGPPLSFSNMSEELEKIIENTLIPILFEGKTYEYFGKDYFNGHYYPFIREIALERVDGRITVDLDQDDIDELKFLSLHYPDFELIAENIDSIFLNPGMYLPFENKELLYSSQSMQKPS